MEKFDFSGWATKANIKCSDGRTIMKDAFKHNDGQKVPLVWNHQHNDPNEVLGHALLENREEGVYAYCTFNDTESGQTAKLLVQHGDIDALSIYANQLKEHMSHVLHGNIREVSLVLAGANPGASIQSVTITHGDDVEELDEALIFTGENISLYHADDQKGETKVDEKKEAEKAEKDKDTADSKTDGEETIADVYNTLTEKQKTVVNAMIGMALEKGKSDEDEDNSEGGNKAMKHNVFDQEEVAKGNALSHADQMDIIATAKMSSVGSLQTALSMYREEHESSLAHGIDEIDKLFPEVHNLNPGAPELIRQDQSWVMGVINKIHKSPFNRIKTRQADARIAELRAHGYQQKGDEKTVSANIKLLGRETTPQTVYRKDELHRDDVIDITDFDVVGYQWGIMKDNMYEELALAALIGDNRTDGDPDKIKEDCIRPIWKDDEFYTIHADVDIAAAKAALQGTNTGANFGDNYIYAEAIITAALYSREKFKGSGTPDLYCTPHLVNVMLLARDLNGRRIYDSKADLAKALNVNSIVEIEQLEDRTRTTSDSKKKKLLGLFVNLNDYTFGATKGGALTRFEDFDIDFNKYKYLLETRLCGTLTKPFAAIALEEPVTEASGTEGDQASG